MKKKIISLLVILSAASLFALAYFSNQLKPTISASSAAFPAVTAVHPSPSPSPSPDVTYTVKADYSQLTPYAPMAEIYTRLSEDDMPELVPSEDYGLLLPYTGEVLYNDIYGDMSPIASRRGLVTLDGMMVTDAVFSDFNNPYIYDEYSNTYSQKPLYILEKYLVDETGSEPYVMEQYAVCALDGSWVTPFDYEKVICCDNVILLIRDIIQDIDVMDYSGKILYNTKALGSSSQLADYRFCFDPDIEYEYGHGFFGYGDGYITLAYRGSSAYINELTGLFKTIDYTNISTFSEGIAAVEKDGLWGYIDTSFSLIIPPAYEDAGSFIDGKAIVKLSTGEFAVIDACGKTLLSTVREIKRVGSFFEVGQDFNNAVIYDSSLHKFFNTNYVDSWNRFYQGYSYIANNQTTVLYDDSVIILSGKFKVCWVKDNYILYGDFSGSKYYLMTVQGAPVAEFTKDYSNYSILHTGGRYDNFVFYFDNGASYSIIDKNGKTISAGYGVVRTVDDTVLFQISHDDYFAYMDTSGTYRFKLSLEDCTAD